MLQKRNPIRQMMSSLKLHLFWLSEGKKIHKTMSLMNYHINRHIQRMISKCPMIFYIDSCNYYTTIHKSSVHLSHLLSVSSYSVSAFLWLQE